MSHRLYGYFVGALLAVFALAGIAGAQTMAAGTVSGVALYNGGAGAGVCPADFWSPPGPSTAPVCYIATMSCPNFSSTVPSLNFIFSYVTPASPFGSIVIFSAAAGRLVPWANTTSLRQDITDKVTRWLK